MRQAWKVSASVVFALATLLAAARSARAADMRTVGGPTAEEVRVAAQAVEGDIPDCRMGCAYRDVCGWPLDPCGGRVGRFEVRLEGTVSWIDDIEGPLGVETGSGNTIRWDDLDYDMAFGARASLAIRLTGYDRIRLRGWWLGGWDDDLVASGVYGFAPPTTVSPLSDVAISSEADLWSVSLDWVRELACCNIYEVDGILGARVTRFDEVATADLRAVAVGAAGPTGRVRAESDNTFYGAEIGASFTAHATPRWSLNAEGVVLLGLLQKEVTVDDSGLFTPGAKTSSADDDGFGWGVELEGSVTFRPMAHVGLTVGYQFFYFADVTRANAAMDFGRFDTGQVQARAPEENLTVHTIFAGVRFDF